MKAGYSLFLLCVILAACRDQGSVPAEWLAASSAKSRLQALRARFPVLGEATAPSTRESTTSSPLHITLPAVASEAVRLEEPASGLKLRATLRGASATPLQANAETLIAVGAYAGSDVIHRHVDGGAEDFVAFDEAPAREELVYDVAVRPDTALRLVGNILEFLDHEGAPRIRIVSPLVYDLRGEHHATLSVHGCNYDRDPRAPWGRPIVQTGADSCAVHVTWRDITYPALVDPKWTTTAAMATGRALHTTTLYSFTPDAGLVLVTGGRGPATDPTTATVEIFSAATRTFAATGSLLTARHDHTALRLPLGANAGKVLVFGGVGADGAPVTSAELFDPLTGTFSAAPALPSDRVPGTATVLATGPHAGWVLLTGGISSSTNAALATSEFYDPATGTSSLGPTMAVARDGADVVRIPVAGGGEKLLFVVHASSSGFAVFDALTLSFTTSSPPPFAPYAGAWVTSGTKGGKVLLIDGDLQSALYDPVQDNFALTGPRTIRRARGTPAGGALTSLAAGPSNTAVLLTGGTNVEIVQAGGAVFPEQRAELYDFNAGEFSMTEGVMALSQPTVLPTTKTSAAFLAGGQFMGPPSTVGRVYEAKIPGQPCGTVDDCLTGFCVDGVCCDRTCDGQCEACNEAGSTGTCSTVQGAPRSPRAACEVAPDPICGKASCSGSVPRACSFTAPGSNCGSLCANSLLTESTCNGAGQCVTGVASQCTGGFACESAESCRSSACVSTSECAAGFTCAQGRCVTGSVCLDERTSRNTAGGNEAKDCSPYRCGSTTSDSPGACLTACKSIDDCVAPNACDPTGKCIPSAADDAGGCAIARGSSSTTAAFAVGLALLAALGRRHRKRVLASGLVR